MGCWFNKHNYVFDEEFETDGFGCQGFSGMIYTKVRVRRYVCSKCGDVINV